MNTEIIENLKQLANKITDERNDIIHKIKQLEDQDAKELESMKVRPSFDVDKAFNVIIAATNAENTIKELIKSLKLDQKALFDKRDEFAQLILNKLNDAGITDEEGSELYASDDVYVQGDKIWLESGQSSCSMGGISAVSICVSRKALEMSVDELRIFNEENKLRGLVDVEVHELEYDGESGCKWCD